MNISDPQGLKAWRTKNYRGKAPKNIWDVLFTPPKTKKEG